MKGFVKTDYNSPESISEQPFQNSETKKCITCGIYFPFNDKYFYRRGETLRVNCKKCHNKYRAVSVARWRKNTKQRIIKYLGGKCKKCGYNKCNDALVCHHKNREEKDNKISDLMKNPSSWRIIEHEIDKCDLLCSNCHAELHHAENRYRLFLNK